MLRTMASSLPAFVAPGHVAWRRVAGDIPMALGLLGVTLFILLATGFIAP